MCRSEGSAGPWELNTALAEAGVLCLAIERKTVRRLRQRNANKCEM